MNLSFIFLILALLAFGLVTFNFDNPRFSQIRVIAAGLAFYILSLLVN